MKPTTNQKLGIKKIIVSTANQATTIAQLVEDKGFTQKRRGGSLSFDKQIRLECDSAMTTWFKVVVEETGVQVVACGIKEKKVEGEIILAGMAAGNLWTVTCYPLDQDLPEIAPEDVVITVEGTTVAKAVPAPKPPKAAGKKAETPPEGAAPPVPRPPVKLLEEGQATGPTVASGQRIVAITKSVVEPDADDFETLVGCEAVIERGSQALVSMGNALRSILKLGLFKPKYESFADYCEKRWGLSQKEAGQIIGVAEVYEALSSGETSQVRASEAVLRLLAKLPRRKLTSTLTRVKEIASGGVITTEMVLTVSHSDTPATPKKRPNADAFFLLIKRLNDALPLVGPAAKRQIKAALDEKPEAEAREVVGDFLELCTKLLGLASWLQQNVKGAKPPKVRPVTRSTKPAGRTSLKVVKTS